jgi:putative ubiquitin-RnfH superfamily antitoxin RatB of RatAB toxin-antitoxin module
MARVTVLFSPAPRQVQEWVLDLPAGACVGDALRASGWGQSQTTAAIEQAEAGIWGRRCTLAQPLREGDRVEIYRGLLVDPKVARRERFRKQGARAAGLFAQRRPGAKQGY